MEEFGVSHTVLAVQPGYRARRRAAATSTVASQISYPAIPGAMGLPSAGGFLFRKIFSEVRRIHRDREIDLIHAHAALPCGEAARLLSRKLGIPFVVSVHGLDVMSTNQFGAFTGKWCRRVSKRVYESASRAICVSDHVRECLQRDAGGEISADVVFNAADPDLFSPKTKFWESAPVILSIGNLIPIKGHDVLLRAVAAISDSHPDLLCQVIGDGPQRGHLAKLAADLGIADRVRFVGRQTRTAVARALQECTVFALPSRYEALGCVYLEAMACGKPVIGCTHQGVEEVVRHGVNGFLIEPEDVHGLSTQLAQLLRDASLRTRVGLAARRSILEGFTLEHQSSRLAAIYRECAA
jgi:teichuronic acid biosynthesis glycosyltransferase TuaC